MTLYEKRARSRKPLTLAESVDKVYDGSRGKGVGAWMLAPCSNAVGSSLWTVTTSMSGLTMMQQSLSQLREVIDCLAVMGHNRSLPQVGDSLPGLL